ncbi:MAG: DNA mismatch repair protein MutS [Thermoprotei archaeon]
MRLYLMYRDRSFDASKPHPWNYEDLVRDLDLNPIIEAMAAGDEFIAQVCTKALHTPEGDVDTILYRQSVLQDTLKNLDTIRRVYSTITQAIAEGKRKLFWIPNPNPESVVFDSIRVLEVYLDTLDRVREAFDTSAAGFSSAGYRDLIEKLDYQFDREYLNRIRVHLSSLRFTSGVSAAVKLDDAAELTGFTLINHEHRRSLRDLLPLKRRYTWSLPERDEAGAQELAEMRNHALVRVAKVLRRAANDVLGFIDSLRTELAFYLGCANLWAKLTTLGVPLCFPTPREIGSHTLGYSCLHEVSLALRMNAKPVCNDLRTTSKPLFLISGANRGGKTVYLRSVGQAQLMMQCGMFVAAERFESSIATGVYTHFKREEDTKLEGGKLDEELIRLSAIVDHVRPCSMVLFNESFSSTNEREGSEIARQVVSAMLERGIRVFFVTHFYEFPTWFYENNPSVAVFLRAERKEDGTRTFRVLEGAPLETSFAMDVYSNVFGDGAGG